MSGHTTPGWYHAQGDPADTQRWWDGSQWVGDPQPAAAQTAADGGFPGAPPAVNTTDLGERYDNRSALEWYKLAWTRWSDFSGRSRRSEYWWFALINLSLIHI